jgi:hypothetical protein
MRLPATAQQTTKVAVSLLLLIITHQTTLKT